jgi:hypothetical protein
MACNRLRVFDRSISFRMIFVKTGCENPMKKLAFLRKLEYK